jgi:hypothetical protein
VCHDPIVGRTVDAERSIAIDESINVDAIA